MADGRRNNGGNPTNGGRKSARDERLKNLVIQKCWEKLDRVIDKIESKEDVKNFCLAIGLKDITQKQDHTTKGDKLPTPIYGGQSTIQGHEVDTEDIQSEEED